MAEHGYYLDNYPNGVCLPGSSMSGDGMTRALRYIPASQFHILIKAMKAADQDRRCGFKAYKSRTSQDIKGMSISHGLQYAPSLLPDAALLESRAPIVVFAPPSGASESERTGYFIDGTIRSTAQSMNATVHQHREISGDADNRIIKRRRIDADRDWRDDQLLAERDIHYLPQQELCPAHSTQAIIPLQLSLGYLLMPIAFSTVLKWC